MKEYNMTYQQALWGISYLNLTMMFADAPFYEPDEKIDDKGKSVKKVAEAKTAADFVNFLK